MKLSQFKFKLPEEQIAQYPAKFRDESRLIGLVRKRYPIREFWELAAETGGIEVVCSSDAHTPSALWRAVPEIIKWAEELNLPVVTERLAKEVLEK